MSPFASPTKKQDRKNLTTIHDLSPHVLDIILNCIPLRDAVRTSVLSKQWRNKYKSISRFIFDRSFFQSVQREKDTYYDIMHRYMTTITNLLFVTDSPIVLDQLHIYIPSWLYRNRAHWVKIWIRVAAKRGIKDLTLDTDEYVELPDFLFSSCLELTHLRVYYFMPVNPPSSFLGFPHLISLRLVLRAIHELDKLEGLISSCPELRFLALCIRFDNRKRSSSMYLHISAPKLERFDLRGGIDQGLYVKFASDATTNIRRVSLSLLPMRYNPGIKSSDPVEFFRGMCNIENLNLEFRFWKLGPILSRRYSP